MGIKKKDMVLLVAANSALQPVSCAMPCCHNSLCKVLACIPPWLTGLDTFWSTSGLTSDTDTPRAALCRGSRWRLKGIHLLWHANTRMYTRRLKLPLNPQWNPIDDNPNLSVSGSHGLHFKAFSWRTVWTLRFERIWCQERVTGLISKQPACPWKTMCPIKGSCKWVYFRHACPIK